MCIRVALGMHSRGKELKDFLGDSFNSYSTVDLQQLELLKCNLFYESIVDGY